MYLLQLLNSRLICSCCNTTQAGADVNLPNNIGDTALHKAAFTGRKVHLYFTRFYIFRFFAPLSYV